MNKRVVLSTLIALVAIAAIFGAKSLSVRKSKAALAAMRPAPASVATAVATPQTWQTTLSAIGTVESSQGVTLRSEIEGRILRIPFQSGAEVQAGDVLVELESANEQAQLKSLEAAAKLASVTLQRARDLRTTDANTMVDLDTAEASHAQALAAVEGMRATLEKKHIVAPFAGRLGIRQVNLGQFLNKGDTIVTLDATDPVYVDFALPQQELPHLKPGLPVHVRVDAFPERVFEGKIEAIDPRVSDSTRNVRVRAVIPNGDETLRPGLFAHVDVNLPAQNEVLQLPSTAIVYSPYGNSVYVVVEKQNEAGEKSLVVEQRFISTGAKRGDQVAILKGLNAGDQVVSAGQMKLRNGAPVTINNTVQPSNSPTPTPAQS